MSKKKNFARFGFAAKGVVYCLTGILTALAAFGAGGKETGSKGALQYLSDQSYGQILLVIMGLGLLGYVFWRMYQAFGNPSDIDNDAKGYAKRVAYFISGVFYGALAYYSFKLGFGSSSGGGSSSKSLGDAVAVIVGIGIAIKAVYDFYQAYSGKFREEVEEMEMDKKEQDLLVNSGKFGHTARGIVLAFMAYLTLRSGLTSGSQINTKTDAFGYIEQEFGSVVLGIIAIGLAGYGIYMLIKARYPSISIDEES